MFLDGIFRNIYRQSAGPSTAQWRRNDGAALGWALGIAGRRRASHHAELVKAVGMSGVSKSQVSRLCAEIDGRVKALLERPIERDWPNLWIDRDLREGAGAQERAGARCQKGPARDVRLHRHRLRQNDADKARMQWRLVAGQIHPKSLPPRRRGYPSSPPSWMRRAGLHDLIVEGRLLESGGCISLQVEVLRSLGCSTIRRLATSSACIVLSISPSPAPASRFTAYASGE